MKIETQNYWKQVKQKMVKNVHVQVIIYNHHDELKFRLYDKQILISIRNYE